MRRISKLPLEAMKLDLEQMENFEIAYFLPKFVFFFLISC